MTSTREPVAAPATHPNRVDAPEWLSIYRAMMAELLAKVETMVDRSVSAHIEALAASLGVPAGVAPAQDAPETPYIQDVRLSPTAPAETAPQWLQLFTMPDQVRFTRTPDSVLQRERARLVAPEPLPEPEVPLPEEPEAYEPEVLFAPPAAPQPEREAVVPLWRRPFAVPPNVRFSRTPDRKRPASPPVEAMAQSCADETATPCEDDEETEFDTLAAQAARSAATADAADRALYALYAEDAHDAEDVPDAVDAQDARHAQDAGSVRDADETPAEPGPARPPGAWLGTVWQGQQQAFRAVHEQDNDAETDEPISPIEEASRVKATIARYIASIRPHGTPPADENAVEVAAREETGVDAAAQGVADEVAFAPAAAVVRLSAPAGQGTHLNRAHPQAASNLAPLAKRRKLAIDPETWEYPPIELLAEPVKPTGIEITGEMLEQNARLLEGVLEDFAIRGEIINVRPGPVVTLYELEPAPGIKSSRVIGLSDDIARSMSAISARVAVVQGRNVIGIELPNERRETVFLRELCDCDEFASSKHKLAIALGKTIGGESVIVDLAKMPHLLVAGTTGSGKSVAINTMILSILYRLRPDQCRLIMIDPKMLELSIYDGIPHLLTPVVTDPKKAVVALKWAVREMEDRYKKMAKVGVRNIDGFNTRVSEARARGEVITRTVQMGYDRTTGEPVFETEEMDLGPIPYIVVIVDEMADLMMVAGKDIEGAIQRLAQMARAAGIHLIMATQRPSVDVITGTIKANFPTRISFQVTSKIDSRTILGEQGAEQLLGQGDMLHMMGGGRIARVHGPFVSDGEVEHVVAHLKTQGHPDYLDVTTEEGEAAGASASDEGEVADEKGGADKPVMDKGAFTAEDNDLYEQAVKVVLRDKKCSTSYIQRRLQVGYNKAASLVERMEKNGMVGAPNHSGKREILVYSRDLRMIDANREEE